MLLAWIMNVTFERTKENCLVRQNDRPGSKIDKSIILWTIQAYSSYSIDNASIFFLLYGLCKHILLFLFLTSLCCFCFSIIPGRQYPHPHTHLLWSILRHRLRAEGQTHTEEMEDVRAACLDHLYCYIHTTIVIQTARFQVTIAISTPLLLYRQQDSR